MSIESQGMAEELTENESDIEFEQATGLDTDIETEAEIEKKVEGDYDAGDSDDEIPKTKEEGSCFLRRGRMVMGEFGRYTHIFERKPDPSLLTLWRQTRSVVVLIHGLGLSNQSWVPVEEILLGKNYATVSYDLIGRGFSENAQDGSYGIKEHVDQLFEDVVNPLLKDFDEVHVIGHSAGGGIAVAFGSEYYRSDAMQGKLKSVTAIAPTGLLYRPALCILQNLPVLNLIFYPFLMNMASQRSAWTIDFEKSGENSLDKEEMKERVVGLQEALHEDPERSSKITNALWKNLEEFPFTNMQQEIQAFANKMKGDSSFDSSAITFTLVWGNGDSVCPIDSAEQWKELFKDSANFVFKELEGLGHGLVQSDTDLVLAAAGY